MTTYCNMQKRNIPTGCSFFGAADRIESIKVLPPSRPAASGCPPDIRIFNCSSPVSLNAKRNIPTGCSFFGAADRTRTGTESPPADFKSAVSTIPPQRHMLIHNNTDNQNRQVGNGTQAVPYKTPRFRGNGGFRIKYVRSNPPSGN